MSSLQNAIKRRTHKERAQPAARAKFGLLEKHKDYVERAKDFHRKENTIKAGVSAHSTRTSCIAMQRGHVMAMCVMQYSHVHGIGFDSGPQAEG